MQFSVPCSHSTSHVNTNSFNLLENFKCTLGEAMSLGSISLTRLHSSLYPVCPQHSEMGEGTPRIFCKSRLSDLSQHQDNSQNGTSLPPPPPPPDVSRCLWQAWHGGWWRDTWQEEQLCDFHGLYIEMAFSLKVREIWRNSKDGKQRQHKISGRSPWRRRTWGLFLRLSQSLASVPPVQTTATVGGMVSSDRMHM